MRFNKAFIGRASIGTPFKLVCVFVLVLSLLMNDKIYAAIPSTGEMTTGIYYRRTLNRDVHYVTVVVFSCGTTHSILILCIKHWRVIK